MDYVHDLVIFFDDTKVSAVGVGTSNSSGNYFRQEIKDVRSSYQVLYFSE